MRNHRDILSDILDRPPVNDCEALKLGAELLRSLAEGRAETLFFSTRTALSAVANDLDRAAETAYRMGGLEK